MAKDKNSGLTAEKLKELGVPEELIDTILETGGPSVNTHAEGGNGGSAVSLTYVDNYSVLFLVYTFLQQTVNDGNAKDKEGKLTNTPVDAFNHAIDAVRYVILNEVLGGEKKAINLQRVAKLVY